MLLIPLDGGDDVLTVPVALAVCWRHRLPKRGWIGFRDQGVRSSLRRLVGNRSIEFGSAWIEHVRLGRELPSTVILGDPRQLH